MKSTRIALSSLVLAALSSAAMAAAPTAQYVISISVDGMGSQYFSALAATNSLPNMQAMIAQGASTLNARTDAGVAVTLPSHTGMVTGRPMNNYTTPAISGHNWTSNSDPAVGQTLATNKGSYIASVFDVAHDSGLKTAMWSGKSKFSLFRDSYNATNGAADVTGVDNGKNKVDYSYINAGVAASTLTSDFTSKMATNAYNYTFVHYQDPDAAGHSYGWGSTQYNTALMAIDTQIGNIMSFVNSNATLSGKTIIMVTADHGGHSTTHGDLTMASDYTIPFLVWGAGVNVGDLYAMNAGTLLSPPTTGGAAGLPQYTGVQPMRNGNLGNLSLELLGLGAIPGSTIGVAQNIAVPEPTSLAMLGVVSTLLLRRRARKH